MVLILLVTGLTAGLAITVGGVQLDGVVTFVDQDTSSQEIKAPGIKPALYLSFIGLFANEGDRIACCR